MINRIIRTAATLGLVGGITAASWLGLEKSSFALPADQVEKILQSVPVFTIVDDKGVPLVAVDEKDKTKKITGIFINQADAKKFYEQFKKQNPTLGDKVSVRLISLGEVYKVAVSFEGKPDALLFSYIPDPAEVEEAKKILTANKQTYAGGVPIFVARGGTDNGYLTVEGKDPQGNALTEIPMFFDLSQLNQMLTSFKQQKPDLAATIKVEVVPLETVLETLKTSNDTNLSKIVFIPSLDSIKAVQSLQQGNGSSPSVKTPSPSPSPSGQK